ncbi:hypothetical protein BJ138DRAFT_1149634 [Hygrophoropsis aurantiaca]|uniref:Uncharacterized protein n=1 Tax=Hygrophoropsis aurantiaca TaxID=72124 RepID=A0ACB8AG31_9AGAM|nr:hypothetical protein BJ138DRAFT_1149634 [Hygrophoropsis aurantiaca]
MSPTIHKVPLPIPPSMEHRLVIGPRLLAVSSESSSAIQEMFLDIETYQQYKFPESASTTASQLADNSKQLQRGVLISSTNVLFIRPHRDRVNLFIQAYRIPSLQGSVSTAVLSQAAPVTLELSHEGTASAEIRMSWVLLRDSELDPITGTIRISTIGFYRTFVSAVSLELSPVLQEIIGSITVETPRRNIPLRDPPTNMFHMTHSLNGSTRILTHFHHRDIVTSCML